MARERKREGEGGTAYAAPAVASDQTRVRTGSRNHADVCGADFAG